MVRFNGQQFKAWAPEAMPQLKSTGVINMHRDRKGRVWISSFGGLFMSDGKTWTLWQENDGWADRTDYVRCYAEDPQGNMLFARFSGKLTRYENGKFRDLPEIGGVGGSWCAYDEEGVLYVSRAGVAHVQEAGETWRALPATESPVLGLGQGRAGEAFMIYAREVVRLRHGATEKRLALSQPVANYWQLAQDQAGALWLPSIEAGVYRIRLDGEVKQFLKADGLPHSGGTRAVLAASDGSVWVGSGVGGCARFRAPRFRYVGEAEGMGDRVVLTLASMGDGRMLLTTFGHGLAFFDGTTVTAPTNAALLAKAYIRSVVRRKDGSVWLGTIGRGLFRLDGNDVTAVPSNIFEAGEPINSMYEDSRGVLWVAGDRQVVRVVGSKFMRVELPKAQPGTRSALFAERKDGTVVITRQNEVFLFNDKGLQAAPLVQLNPDQRITTVLADAQDRLWLGTAAHGLYVLEGGKLGHVGIEQGLPGASIASLVQSNLGKIWFGSDRRVVRVDPAELAKAARGETTDGTVQIFDQNDGLRDLDFPDYTQPSVAKDEKGRLWFALVRGAAMVDPTEIKQQTTPPPVVIESVSYVPQGATHPVERSVPKGSETLTLPAGSRLIRISYAALEFLAPRKQQFRVRLDDSGEWQDMRNEAVVSFLELLPGPHIFQVQAADSDGAWNRLGTRLKLEITPYYWQTGWFRGLAGMGLAGLMAGGVWIVSIRRIRAEREKLERERRLAEAQARLALVLESTSDFVQFSDPAGDLIYLNRAGRTMLGLSVELELRAVAAMSLLPAWARETFDREVRPALEREGNWAGELALRHCDGREIPVSLVMLAHRAKDGRLDFTSMIARDVSAAKRHALVQDALRRLAAALTAGLDAEALGRTVAAACRRIFAHDMCFLVLLDEKGAVERALYTEDTPEGEATPREFPPTIRSLSAALEPVTKGTPLLINRDPAGMDAPQAGLRPVGSVDRRGASLMYVPVLWTSKVIGVLAVHSYQLRRYNQADLQQLQTLADHCGAAIARMKTEALLRKNEEHLRQSQKLEAVGTMAGGIAHDFNNILTAILGNVELAGLDIPGEGPLHDYLSQIKNSTHRARDLVRRLLTFSRPQEAKRQVVALAPVVEEVVKLLRATIPSGVEIETALTAQVPDVEADSSELHQVLLNLGTNAAHALGSRNGRIEFRVRVVEIEPGGPTPHPDLQPGKYACIEVRDDGKGIPPDVVPRIFDPFFTTKAPGEGTGLGLSMAHGIMRAHGGAITVSSEVGVGTVFQLYFPASAQARSDSRSPIPAPTAGPKPGRGERILCVDDEPAIVMILQRVLRNAGYRPTGCANALEGLMALEASVEGFDLIITDLSMPRMSGLEFTRQIHGPPARDARGADLGLPAGWRAGGSHAGGRARICAEAGWPGGDRRGGGALVTAPFLRRIASGWIGIFSIL
jgi:PAS domain S-box-containing protein